MKSNTLLIYQIHGNGTFDIAGDTESVHYYKIIVTIFICKAGTLRENDRNTNTE